MHVKSELLEGDKPEAQPVKTAIQRVRHEIDALRELVGASDPRLKVHLNESCAPLLAGLKSLNDLLAEPVPTTRRC